MHGVPELRNSELFKQKNLVDGRWIDSESGDTFAVIGTRPSEHFLIVIVR